MTTTGPIYPGTSVALIFPTLGQDNGQYMYVQLGQSATNTYNLYSDRNTGANTIATTFILNQCNSSCAGQTYIKYGDSVTLGTTVLPNSLVTPQTNTAGVNTFTLTNNNNNPCATGQQFIILPGAGNNKQLCDPVNFSDIINLQSVEGQLYMTYAGTSSTMLIGCNNNCPPGSTNQIQILSSGNYGASNSTNYNANTSAGASDDTGSYWWLWLVLLVIIIIIVIAAIFLLYYNLS